MDERNNHFDFDFTPIGQAIKKAREARGMTREEFSGIIGYAPRHLQAIENEGQYPSLEEEFRQEVISAWTRGGYREKITAVFHGGEREWSALWNDEDANVRGAVVFRASEEYQMRLVGAVSAIRQYLATYSTDRVRMALLERGETDRYVLKTLAKFGNTEIRRRLLPVIWDQYETLHDCLPYLPQSCLEKLLAHPNADIHFPAALHGNREQIRRMLSIPGSYLSIMDRVERPLLFDRMEELNELAEAISLSKTRTRKYENMELSK